MGIAAVETAGATAVETAEATAVAADTVDAPLPPTMATDDDTLGRGHVLGLTPLVSIPVDMALHIIE